MDETNLTEGLQERLEAWLNPRENEQQVAAHCRAGEDYANSTDVELYGPAEVVRCFSLYECPCALFRVATQRGIAYACLNDHSEPYIEVVVFELAAEAEEWNRKNLEILNEE